MKKRTCCFGWTKGFQRITAAALSRSTAAGKLDAHASLLRARDPHGFKHDISRLQEAAKQTRADAEQIIRQVRISHRHRVQSLRGA